MKKLNQLIIAVAMLATESVLAQADTTNITQLPLTITRPGVYIVRDHFPGSSPLYMLADTQTSPEQVPPAIRITCDNVTVMGEVLPAGTYEYYSYMHLATGTNFTFIDDSVTVGIFLDTGVKNIKVKNLSIYNFANGVSGYHNENVVVENCELVANWYQANFYRSEGIVVRNNRGGYGGILLEEVQNCLAERNNLFPIFWKRPGIYISGSENKTRGNRLEGISDNYVIAFIGDRNTSTEDIVIGSGYTAKAGVFVQGDDNLVERIQAKKCKYGVWTDGARNSVITNELVDNVAGIFSRNSINSRYSGNFGENTDAGINFWVDDRDPNTVIVGNYGCGNTVSGIARANAGGFDENGNRYGIPGNHINEWSDSLGTVCGMSVTEREFDPAPKEFALAQNYPNPFNPTTTIKFSLPHPSNVSLTACDVRGRHVETLINGRLAPGSYRLVWNAEGLPSGIYFALLQMEEGVKHVKMTFVR